MFPNPTLLFSDPENNLLAALKTFYHMRHAFNKERRFMKQKNTVNSCQILTGEDSADKINCGSGGHTCQTSDFMSCVLGTRLGRVRRSKIRVLAGNTWRYVHETLTLRSHLGSHCCCFCWYFVLTHPRSQVKNHNENKEAKFYLST